MIPNAGKIETYKFRCEQFSKRKTLTAEGDDSCHFFATERHKRAKELFAPRASAASSRTFPLRKTMQFISSVLFCSKVK